MYVSVLRYCAWVHSSTILSRFWPTFTWTAKRLAGWWMIIGCFVLRNLFDAGTLHLSLFNTKKTTGQLANDLRLDNIVSSGWPKAVFLFGTENGEGQKTSHIWPVQRSAVWSRAQEQANLQDSLHEQHRPHNLLYLYFKLLFSYCFERCIFSLCVPCTDVMFFSSICMARVKWTAWWQLQILKSRWIFGRRVT